MESKHHVRQTIQNSFSADAIVIGKGNPASSANFSYPTTQVHLCSTKADLIFPQDLLRAHLELLKYCELRHFTQVLCAFAVSLESIFSVSYSSYFLNPPNSEYFNFKCHRKTHKCLLLGRKCLLPCPFYYQRESQQDLWGHMDIQFSFEIPDIVSFGPQGKSKNDTNLMAAISSLHVHVPKHPPYWSGHHQLVRGKARFANPLRFFAKINQKKLSLVQNSINFSLLFCRMQILRRNPSLVKLFQGFTDSRVRTKFSIA